MTIEEIAKVSYEINRSYCESIGDHSFGPWESAPAWQKETNKKGVLFMLGNPGSPPQSLHESWLKEKQKNGWTYGPLKDESKKQHPCLLPYEALPIEQRVKDHLFKQVVESLKGFLAGV